MRAVAFTAAAVAAALAACVGGGGPLPDESGQTGSGERSPSVETSGERDEGSPVVREDVPTSPDPEDERDAATDGG